MNAQLRIGYISAHRGRWSVAAMCRVLGVSEAGYYKHLRRAGRPDRHAELLALIKKCITEEEDNANYGVRRICLWLWQRGLSVSQSTVRRVCRENNLMIRPKRNPHGITRADRQAEKAENIIKQDFSAHAPNQKWLTDITEIACSDAKLYLSPVLDCYDGSIVGYKMATNMRAELCVESLRLACRRTGARGMLLHSDRGSQYTSRAFRRELEKHGATQSMSGVGRCYDNARMESFFASLKKEKLYRMDTRKMTAKEVMTVVVEYIAYYNLRRITTVNPGGWPPAVARRKYFEGQTAA